VRFGPPPLGQRDGGFFCSSRRQLRLGLRGDLVVGQYDVLQPLQINRIAAATDKVNLRDIEQNLDNIVGNSGRSLIRDIGVRSIR